MEILIVAVLAIVFTLAIQYVTGVFDDSDNRNSLSRGGGNDNDIENKQLD